jgi:hypothetical protein
VFLSYKNHKITEVNVKDSELKRYKKIYNPQKFETFREIEFKLLISTLLLEKRFSSLQSLLSYLSSTDIKTLNKYISYDELIQFPSFFNQDKEKVDIYDKSIPLIVSLYKQKEISFLYTYYYLYHNQDKIKGRIQNRLFQDLRIFLSYFSKIKTYLEQLD